MTSSTEFELGGYSESRSASENEITRNNYNYRVLGIHPIGLGERVAI